MKKPRKAKSSDVSAPVPPVAEPSTDRLLADVRTLIEAARQQVAQAVNAGLVTLYWNVGKRIRQEVLGEERAAYGEQIVHALSGQLTAEYGRGFDRRNLFHMVRFAEVFPDEQIVYALRTQLTWTHFRELIAIDDPLKREFYAEMCRAERWSTRTLQDQIKRMVYLRWLEKHETHPDEEPPIGLILCAGKSAERVELLQLEAAGIRVAEYLTELPPREMLQRKLHDAILLAREQLARKAELTQAAPQIEPPAKESRKGKKRR